MSVVDEDTELRDLLVQTLDKNGVLGKIKVSFVIKAEGGCTQYSYWATPQYRIMKMWKNSN